MQRVAATCFSTSHLLCLILGTSQGNPKYKQNPCGKYACVCPCLRLNLLSIAGRARLLILRLEESERLQELGEKLLVLMFKLHFHTAHVDLLLLDPTPLETS